VWQVQTKNSSLFFQILWDGCEIVIFPAVLIQAGLRFPTLLMRCFKTTHGI
jgi:hypothetical protein